VDDVYMLFFTCNEQYRPAGHPDQALCIVGCVFACWIDASCGWTQWPGFGALEHCNTLIHVLLTLQHAWMDAWDDYSQFACLRVGRVDDCHAL
jgi:hypothetical protein